MPFIFIGYFILGGGTIDSLFGHIFISTNMRIGELTVPSKNNPDGK